MTWYDIARKLTSRKLWVAVAGFVTAIMLYRGADSGSIEAIGSLIMAGASVVAYIVGEGLVDAKREGAGMVAEILPEDVIGRLTE